MPAAGAAADSTDQKGDKGQVRSSTAGRLDGQPLHGTAGRTVTLNFTRWVTKAKTCVRKSKSLVKLKSIMKNKQFVWDVIIFNSLKVLQLLILGFT